MKAPRTTAIRSLDSFETEVDTIHQAEWSAIIQRFADANIYQTWQYGAVRWGSEKLSHLLLKEQGEVVACAQVAIFRAPVISAGVAYLRWGPLYHPAQGAIARDPVPAMLEALRNEYAVRRRLLLKVIPHPLKERNRSCEFQSVFEKAGFSRNAAGFAYRTLLVDLSPPLEQLRKQLAQKWRCDLNRAERNELTVKAGTSTDFYDKFTAIYAEMLDRKRFTSSMDVGEFRAIQQGLPEAAKMRILLCEWEGETVAAAVFSALGDTGIYLLGATSAKGMKSKGSNLLQWKIIQWLKENGYRYYDLAGIDPVANPGGYHFKSGLGGKEISFAGSLESCDSLSSRMVGGLTSTVVPVYSRLRSAARETLRRMCV
ncbi:MAG TPA: peptidoglycan bridge formation glycyltransferase FemA/FemB family protein [Geomonas sp.]|nr:peptidoglycan bridge formation glycyltransferase FemA/FemB family protein [Geomonas sp.]